MTPPHTPDRPDHTRAAIEDRVQEQRRGPSPESMRKADAIRLRHPAMTVELRDAVARALDEEREACAQACDREARGHEAARKHFYATGDRAKASALGHRKNAARACAQNIRNPQEADHG